MQTPDLKLPAQITVAYQPYGWYTLTDLKIVLHPRNPQIGGDCDRYRVEGRVTQGSWCGALWCGVPVVKSQDITGETRDIWGLTQDEIDRHVTTNEPIVRIAM